MLRSRAAVWAASEVEGPGPGSRPGRPPPRPPAGADLLKPDECLRGDVQLVYDRVDDVGIVLHAHLHVVAVTLFATARETLSPMWKTSRSAANVWDREREPRARCGQETLQDGHPAPPAPALRASSRRPLLRALPFPSLLQRPVLRTICLESFLPPVLPLPPGPSVPWRRSNCCNTSWGAPICSLQL